MNHNMLNNQQLTQEIEKLERRIGQYRNTLVSRTGGVTYECQLCGLVDNDFDVVYEHIKRDHRYPDEDANMCVKRIFI